MLTCCRQAARRGAGPWVAAAAGAQHDAAQAGQALHLPA